MREITPPEVLNIIINDVIKVLRQHEYWDKETYDELLEEANDIIFEHAEQNGIDYLYELDYMVDVVRDYVDSELLV